MSKQDRAAELIEFGAKRGYTPEQTATLLNKFNLLVPDLPGLRFFPDTEEYESDVVDGYINLHRGEITVSYDERDEDTYLTDPAPEPGEIRIHPHDAVEALAKAGLITPDLPEPSRGMTAPRGKVWYLDGPIGDIRRTGEDIVVFGHDCRHQSFRLVLNKAEAETIAHTLLAAARYQEEE